MAACNQYYSSSYSLEGSKLMVGKLARNMRGCRADHQESQGVILGALASVETFEIVDGELVLSGTSVEMVFSATERAE